VANDDHGTGELFEFVEEPPLGRFVEVVRWFVEDHRFGLLVEHPHQVDAAALST